MDDLILETAGLHKTYDGFDALRGLDLQVPSGSICGFLGKNGAGKTTTIKILLGIAHATSGVARVFGAAPDAAARQRIGFVSEEKELYGYMTVADMISFTQAFFPRWRIDLQQRYVRRFDLPLTRKVKELSRGVRTKLALLLAFCRGAELLILDEPTSGLDPAAANDVLQAIVGHVADEAMTVFFSSHQISDVEQIADRVAIIDRGKSVVTGALDELRQQFCRIEIVLGESADAPPALRRMPGVVRVTRSGRLISVFSNGGAEAVEAEAAALGATSIEVVPVTLKEIFLESVSGEE